MVSPSLYPSHHQLESAPMLHTDDVANNSDLMLLDEDGSDSLLSASRLNKSPTLEPPMLYPRRRSLGSHQEMKIESPSDFEFSESILDERVPRKRINLVQNNCNSLGSKLQYSKCTNTVQRKTERRKYIRRCQSQDHLEAQESSKSSSRGVMDHIRKFESMNSFDDHRNLSNQEDFKLRRSESFHQTYAKEFGNDVGMTYNMNDVKQRSMIDALVTRERTHSRRRPSNEEKEQKNDKYTSFFDKKKDYAKQNSHDEWPDDSRIFAGRHHDVLGFGKNRFNAGKYSGNAHLQQFSPPNAHRHVQQIGHHVRGKVTDVLSGLY